MPVSALPCVVQHFATRQPAFGKTPHLPQFSGTKVAFWSDFDGTWRDNTRPAEEAKAARDKLEQALPGLKAEYAKKGIDLEVNYVSARPPSLILKQNLPTPGYAITYNGGMIHQGLPVPGKAPLQDWMELNQASGFDAHQVLQLGKALAAEKYPNLVVQTIGETVGSADADASPLIATLCVTNRSIQLAPGETKALFDQKTYQTPQQIQAFLQDLSRLVEQKGMQFKVTQPYLFSGRPFVMFDIAAPKANKGEAIDFMIRKEKIKPEYVLIAGDGGNDIEMMKPDGRKLIVVGPNKVLRDKVRAMNYESAIIRPENEVSSEGVLAGLRQHLDTIAAELQKRPLQFAGHPIQQRNRFDRIA